MPGAGAGLVGGVLLTLMKCEKQRAKLLKKTSVRESVEERRREGEVRVNKKDERDTRSLIFLCLGGRFPGNENCRGVRSTMVGGPNLRGEVLSDGFLRIQSNMEVADGRLREDEFGECCYAQSGSDVSSTTTRRSGHDGTATRPSREEQRAMMRWSVVVVGDVV